MWFSEIETPGGSSNLPNTYSDLDILLVNIILDENCESNFVFVNSARLRLL